MAGQRNNPWDAGTPHGAAQYAMHANWGTTPTVVPVASDTGGRVSITAQATTGANPTVVLTFKDGAFKAAPVVVCARGDIVAPTTGFWVCTAVTTTTATFTFVGTPVAASVYVLSFIVVG